jgi:hypothetical protein
MVKQTDRQTKIGDLISLTFLFMESRLRNMILHRITEIYSERLCLCQQNLKISYHDHVYKFRQ